MNLPDLPYLQGGNQCSKKCFTQTIKRTLKRFREENAYEIVKSPSLSGQPCKQINQRLNISSGKIKCSFSRLMDSFDGFEF